MDLRRTLQRHDWQMFATFDEVDLERELISRLTGNQRLRLRTPRLARPPGSWLASWFKIGGWKRVMDLVWGATIERRMWSMLVIPVPTENSIRACIAGYSPFEIPGSPV